MTKRLFDLLLSAVSLVLLSPVFFLIWFAVLLDSGSPAMFSQRRVGKDFRSFRLYKFRTMRVTNTGSSITVAGDSRVTRIGALLRATKLDELPQLWNVLRGDMSLVGPRPELPEFVELFRERYGRLLEARPGITDLASVRFRDEEGLLSATQDPSGSTSIEFCRPSLTWPKSIFGADRFCSIYRSCSKPFVCP